MIRANLTEFVGGESKLEVYGNGWNAFPTVNHLIGDFDVEDLFSGRCGLSHEMNVTFNTRNTGTIEKPNVETNLVFKRVDSDYSVEVLRAHDNFTRLLVRFNSIEEARKDPEMFNILAKEIEQLHCTKYTRTTRRDPARQICHTTEAFKFPSVFSVAEVRV